MNKTLEEYVNQGYKIPDGYTPGIIQDVQWLWMISDIYVPITWANHVVAWGVPHNADGSPMKHGYPR